MLSFHSQTSANYSIVSEVCMIKKIASHSTDHFRCDIEKAQKAGLHATKIGGKNL